MLRQLYMTHRFYEVTERPYQYSPSSPFSPPSLLPPIDSQLALPGLYAATFYLYPYLNPDSRRPPQSHYSRRYDAFCYLQSLSDADKQLLLIAYRDNRYANPAQKNPTLQTNPYWQWIVRFNLSVWEIRKLIIDKPFELLETTSHTQPNPLWCHQRMGQSQTLLPDGRTILIGGEYEDWYDPEFCIYNDVIVIRPNNGVRDDSENRANIEIYSYPKALFAPTDFHTATLVGNYIYIIGALGYPSDRRYSHTPVYRLDIHTFKIEEVATRNSMGWIYKHNAALKDNQIVVTGGQYLLDIDSPIMDNLDTWALNLNTLIWKNITHRNRHWQRFYIARMDGSCLNLDEYRQLNDCQNTHNSNRAILHALEIEACIGCLPDLDSYHQLLVPPVAHETPSDWDKDKELVDYDKILFIEGIKVGYKSADDCIHVIIEGRLSEDIVDLLQQNLRHKLSKVENMACEVIDLE